jgi:hypothetical protein
MDKHKIFFEKIGILNDADFTALTQYANVEVHLPSKNNILVTIEITINKPLPVDIFKKIYHATLRLSDQIKIILKSRIGDLEIDYVIEYIQFFIQIHNIQKICIDNILKRKAINITESGLLIFHYFNRVEMNELKDIEIPLLSFFKQSAIAITGIDYQLDQERQDLAIHKQKQLDKILINNIYSPSPKEIIIKKATDQNAIKEKNIDPINQLQIEDLTAVIQGEIFKVEKILSKKKAILIYKLSITDNQGAITITAFAQNTINN